MVRLQEDMIAKTEKTLAPLHEATGRNITLHTAGLHSTQKSQVFTLHSLLLNVWWTAWMICFTCPCLLCGAASMRFLWGLQETTSKFDFTRRGEHAQEFSYTQGAARRTELRRLQAYVKMADYMVCDALQEVGPCRQLQTCCPAARPPQGHRLHCHSAAAEWALDVHESLIV